jgi:hypothetical protein
MTFTLWLRSNFVEIDGYYYGCPVLYEGRLLTKEDLKEIWQREQSR